MTGIMAGLSTFSSFVWATDQMLANPAEQASAIIYLVLSMVACFCLWSRVSTSVAVCTGF